MVNFSLVVLLDSPNKGLVLTARHALSPGTLLVKERPYFTTHNPDNYAGFLDTTDQMEVKISQEVERKLSKQQADAFRSLLNNFPKYPLSGILKTNGLRCGWNLTEENFSIEDITVDGLPRYGVYPTISYASHSCSPNAHYSWDPDTGMGRVYAISTILPGQSITIMRTSWVIFSKGLRQKSVRNRLGYNCECDLCTGKKRGYSNLDEIRRDEMQWYYHGQHQKLPTEGRNHALLLRINAEYPYSDGTPLHARLYGNLYDEYRLRGEMNEHLAKDAYAKANYFAERAYQAWATCKGERSWNAQKFKELWEKPVHQAGLVMGDTPASRQAVVRDGMSLEQFEDFVQATPAGSYEIDENLTPLPCSREQHELDSGFKK